LRQGGSLDLGAGNPTGVRRDRADEESGALAVGCDRRLGVGHRNRVLDHAVEDAAHGSSPSRGSLDRPVEEILRAAAASRTTCSRTARYSTYRFCPSVLSRQVVCGRFCSKPFATSTRPASCSTCRCRLRLPSVSPQSDFRSLKRSPLGCRASEVSTLSRARSWITRSRPG